VKQKQAYFIACTLAFSLLLTACGQKDIGAEKAEKLALGYIDQYFRHEETSAEVRRYLEDHYFFRDGMTIYDRDESKKQVNYLVSIEQNETRMLYSVWLSGSTGQLITAQQSEINIILTQEQKQKANELYAQERTWGEKHEAALAELKDACIEWVQLKLMKDDPVLFAAPTGDYAHEEMPISTTFVDRFYVVMYNGTIYDIQMQWPSMSVLAITVVNESNPK
jgi:hypothetical protein